MSEGYDMLTAALMNDFERLGIQDEAMELDNLTLGQIARDQGDRRQRRR